MSFDPFDPFATEQSEAGLHGRPNRSPAPAAVAVEVVLRMDGTVEQSVALIQTLGSWGLGLRRAHDVLRRLGEGERLPPIRLSNAPEPETVIKILARFGIAADAAENPAPIATRMRSPNAGQSL